MQSIISQRTALSVLSASALRVSTMHSAASSTDALLRTLGRDFDAAAAKLDHAIITGIDVDNRVLEELADCTLILSPRKRPRWKAFV